MCASMERDMMDHFIFMEHSPEDLATELLRALTPSGQPLVQADIQLTAMSPAAALVQDLVEKGKPKDLAHQIGKLLTATHFAKALCFGVPRYANDARLIPQLVYSASTVTNYCQFLKVLLSGLNSYCHSLWKTTHAIVNGQAAHAAFQSEAVGLVSYFSVLQVFVQACDLEHRYFPATYGVPLINEKFNTLQQLIVQFVQGGDRLRVDAGNRQPTVPAEADFSKVYHTLISAVPTYTQLLDALIQRLKSLFDPMYSESAYVEWQYYASELVDSTVLLVYLSLGIGLNGEIQVLGRNLQQLTTIVFDMVSPIQALLRFRGKFDDGIKEAKDASSKAAQVCVEVLHSIIAIVPRCNSGIQEFYSSQASYIFEQFQHFYSQYPNSLDALIVTMKKDRRFSVFCGLRESADSQLTAQAIAAMETIREIVVKLQRNSAPVQILECEHRFKGFYDTVMSLFTQYIENEQDQTRKVNLVSVKEATSLAAEVFFEGCQGLVGSSESVTRTKRGILAVNVALCLCSIEAHPVLVNHLQAIREVLQEQIISFFPCHVKSLLDLLETIVASKGEMKPDAENSFSTVYTHLVPVLKDSTDVFRANRHRDVPENVIACIREYDRMQPLIQALTLLLKTCELPTDLSTKVQRLDDFSFCPKYLPSSFRLVLQLNMRQATETFTRQMTPFLELVDSVATLQSDSYYRSFLQLKNDIVAALKGVQESLRRSPPHGIYDHKFLVDLVASVVTVFQPSAALIGECQEILKYAPDPDTIRITITDVTQTLNIMTQMMPYVNAMYTQHRVLISTHVAVVVRSITERIEENIRYLCHETNMSATDIAQRSTRLLHSLYELAETTDTTEEFHPLTEELRKIGRSLCDISGRVALGDASGRNLLLTTTRTIQELTGRIQPVVVRCIGTHEVKKEVTVCTKVAQSKHYEEFITTLPEAKQLDEMFGSVMASDNNTLKGVVGGHIDIMKCAIDEFKRTYDKYLQEPSNTELNAHLKKLASKIEHGHETVKLSLKGSTNMTSESLSLMLQKFRALALEQRASAQSGLVVAMASYINNNTKDPSRTILTSLLAEISKELLDNDNETNMMRLQVLGECVTGDARTKTLDLLDKVRVQIPAGDTKQLQDLVAQLLVADRVARAVVGESEPSSVHTQFTAQFANIGAPTKNAELIRLLSQWEDSLLGVAEVPDSLIAERVLDLNSEIAALGTQIVADLKKGDHGHISQNVDEMRTKSLDVISVVLTAACRRITVSGDITSHMQEEILTLLGNMDSFRREAQKAADGDNSSTQLRLVGKASRDITMSLNRLSEICDEILEVPISSGDGASEDYNYLSNMVIADALRVSQLSNAPTARVDRALKDMKTNIDRFATIVKSVTQGTNEEKTLQEKLLELQRLFTSATDTPIPAISLASEIRKLVSDTFNTELIAHPEAVADLPCRFTLPTIPDSKPRPVLEIKPIIEARSQEAKTSLQTLVADINNVKTLPANLCSSVKAFHQSLANLIVPLAEMQAATWNPQCQTGLSQAQSAIVSIGDNAIDTTRSRLLALDAWRELVSQFASSAASALQRLLEAAEATARAAASDIAATNEAERELLAAARAIAASQQRLAQYKTEATTVGDAYVGCEIIDIATPILNSAARLIAAAQEQTRFLLRRDPQLPNQQGLVKTARDLVDSLELILVAAEATVNNEPDAISKILGSCNIISSAVAHFLAECYQKNGSPELNQVMTSITDTIQSAIKHLRAHAESVSAPSSAPDRPGRPLNAMIAKLNAEAKVVEARRALEAAEQNLKKTRQNAA